MKRKKFLAVFMTAVMGLSFGACGEEKEMTGKKEDKEINEDVENEEIYNIVMEIPTLGTEPTGLAEVEAAINEIVEPAIGVNVTLYPLSLSDLNSQTNLMIASGDKLDLVSVIGGLPDYVSKNALIELDELYEKYGQDIKEAEGVAMSGGYYDGKLYAIPSEEKMASMSGFHARKDVVEELGFTFERDKIYTLDDLTALFKAYKEKYGDGYYCVAGTGSNTEFFTYFHNLDYLGSSTATGVLMGGGLDGNTTVTNMYDTPEYEEYAKLMYSWAQEGYYSPDASTNTDSNTTQVQSGYYLGCFMGTEADSSETVSKDCGTEMIPINLTDRYTATQRFQSTMWSIPYTCENPEKTFQFLNMLYADNDLDNILTYGLEGISYEVVEKGEKPGQQVIRFADGIDASNSPYHMPLAVYGDKMTVSVMEPSSLKRYQQVEELNAGITDKNKSCTLGYVFNATDVAAQLSAVNTVIQQYSGMIATGAQNPEKLLPEFRQALHDAGMDEIIDENQRQLDAWLAEQQ